MVRNTPFPWKAFPGGWLFLFVAAPLCAQGSAALGNGLSAAAIARGGSVVTERSGLLDAVEGNPAGLTATGKTLDVSALGMIAGGTFSNSANRDAPLTGVAGALPYGAFALPLDGAGRWTAAVAVTPEILMRAHWTYVDAPGTAGVTYGQQTQETQIIAVRTSATASRTLGRHWFAGASVGVVYNRNDLHAPYIFQQQPQLAGLKVLLNLTTHGYGWNGGAGVQWQLSARVRAGVAWKSGTTLHTHGEATGSASALFAALGISADSTYAAHAQVLNHLPQAADAGVEFQAPHQLRIKLQGDVIAWRQAFETLPASFTGATNAVINQVVGADHFADEVPLHWSNQTVLHAGFELPVRERYRLRGGYALANNPVPASTLTPLTAAIMQQSVATGAGYVRGRCVYDLAYQAQLPVTQTVGVSALQAGEYSHSSVRVWTQSLTFTTQIRF